MTAALDIRNLEFQRRDGFRLAVPELTVQPGEQVLLAGPSGCGKSTLLLLAAGLLNVDQGSIRIGGDELVGLGGAARDALRASRIGMIFQTHHLLPGFSARENVATAMLFAGVPHRDHAAEAGELLSSLGIDRPDARVERQSVGQQQRIAIARALAAKPALILADEPTASLDPENARTAVALLQNACRERGAALVLTSHDPSLVDAFERRIDFADLVSMAGVPDDRSATDLEVPA